MPIAPSSSQLRDLHSFTLANDFAGLPPAFYTHLQATPLPDPYLICASAPVAQMLGLDPASFHDPAFTACFSGNRELAGSRPLAAVYSGHQFGVWAGQLGDGRALLLGNVHGPDGVQELQLKGAGKTPYSRMGDGRAVLRSSIREFLCSEAMAGLGIPTSRALCITGSDYPVFREDVETAAVVTRVAPSFVRFGSFEHWFYAGKEAELKQLADYVLQQFYPQLLGESNPYAALLRTVTARTAELVAQWQAVGFMHGVLNTDNMSILGLTIDYGPFGFMQGFDPAHICNHSDSQGRYSYQMQPQIGHWNCYALGQALLPLIGDVDTTHEALSGYSAIFGNKMDDLLHAKLGLQSRLPQDKELFDAMFALMAQQELDFTLFFRRLSRFASAPDGSDAHLAELSRDGQAVHAWCAQYRARLQQEGRAEEERQAQQLACNPKYVLRNYLAQVAIEKAQQKDFSEINTLLQVLQDPFAEHPEHEHYAALPPDWAYKLEVSCSS